MKLRSISAVGLKGPDFSHQLSDATAIIGPNAAGKTRILQAIRLALGGHLPECGKTPRATWELASGPELLVQVHFDNGSEISRRFWLEGDKLRLTEEFAPLPFAKEAVMFESLPLLNAEAYFELTDSKRTEYVFERIKLPDSYTPAAIIAECERLSFEEEHTEQVETAKADVLSEVRKWFSPGTSGTYSIQEGLASAINELRERFTYWNSRAKATQGAVTTLAELKLRETSVVAAAQGVQEAITKARSELEQIIGKKGELTAKQMEAERTAKRKAQIRKELDADRIDYPRMIEKLETEIADTGKKIGKELEPNARAILVEAIKDSRAAMSALDSQCGQQRAIILEAEKQASQLTELQCCPFCKSKGKGWKANLGADLATTIEKARSAYDHGMTQLQQEDELVKEMEAQLESSDNTARANSQIRLTLESKTATIQGHGRDQTRVVIRRQELSEELDGLGVLPEEKDLTAAIAQHDIAVRDTRQQISELRDRKDAETRLQQQLVSAAQAELEHQDAAAHVTVIKAIAKLLKEKREAMIEEAFGGLLTIANKLTEGILKAPLALHENTIGMWLGAKFVPHRVLSGTEKALAYIAIAVALSSTAPLRLVILDEFGRLDEENQMKVLLRLSLLQLDGVIDQFIVVGTSLPAELDTSNVHLEVIKVKP